MPSAVKPFSASPWHNPGEPGEVTFVTHGVKIIRRFFGNPRKRTTGRGLIWTRAALSAHVSALYSDSSASFIAAFAVGLEPVATPSLTDHRGELVPCRPALRSGIAVWQELTAHGPRPANATACRSISPSCDNRQRGMLWGGSIFAITDTFRPVEYSTVRPVLRPPQAIINF